MTRDEQTVTRENLKRAAEQLSVVIDSLPVVTYIDKAEGDYGATYISENVTRVTGYRPEDFVSNPGFWAQNIHPDDKPEVFAKLSTLVDNGDLHYEYRWKIADGTYRWFADSCRVIKGSDGKPSHVVGVWQDITERKSAREELLRARKAVENSGEIIFLTDQDGVITYVNPMFTELYGYSNDEVVGQKTPRLLKSGVLKQEDYEAFWKTILSRQGFRGEFTNKAKDGRLLTIESSVDAILDENEQITGFVAIQRDVTERKRAEEALRESEERYRKLIENSVDPIYLFDAETRRLLNANPAFLRVVGYESHEIPGLTVYDIVADEKENIDSYVEKVRTAGGFALGERQWRRKNGGLVDVHVSVSKIHQGSQILILVVGRDISELKRVEKELRSSETKFRVLSQTAPVSIFVYGADSFRHVNSTAVKTTGYSADEFMKMKFWEVIDPEHRELVRQRGIARLGGENVPSRYEVKLLTKDGRALWVDYSASLIDFGSEQAVLGIALDITDRRQAEIALAEERNLLRTLIDNLPDPIYVKDTGSRFVTGNRAVLEHLGAQKVGDVVGKTDFDFFPQDLAEHFHSEEQDIIHSGTGIYSKEERTLDRAGNPMWVLTTKVPLHNSEGKVVGLVGVNRNITERKRLEQQLLQAQKMESLGTLAGGIAHDFNNILGIIMGHASLLEDPKRDPKRLSRSVGAIQKAVERGTGLVRQLLTSARKTEVRLESVNVNTVVEELKRMLVETFPKTITFSLRLGLRVPSIIGDHNQIHQTLLNLCLNAREAMPKGGVITIETGKSSGDDIQQEFPDASADEYVWIKVKDTGTGMGEVTKNRIFEPFFTTREIGKGTGLGLSVVYGIIKSHNGFVDVESEVGRGTTFHLYIPVQQRRIELVETRRTSHADAPGGSETILFVEDEQMLLDMLKTLLESKGYHVLTARDGVTAMKTYQKQNSRIDLVLMDTGLPKLGGWDAFQKMKGMNPKVKVILVSGFVDPNMKSEILKSGVKDFVPKPYKPNEILKRIRKVLDVKT